MKPTGLSAKILIRFEIDCMFLFPPHVLGLIPVMFGYLGLLQDYFVDGFTYLETTCGCVQLSVVILVGFMSMQRIQIYSKEATYGYLLTSLSGIYLRMATKKY